MENIPPSYEAAVARDPWAIIAPYVNVTTGVELSEGSSSSSSSSSSAASLCALSCVSRKLNAVFAPQLWGNPGSHFGRENNRVYVALTRFRRILKRVRLSVRQLTHTLHLPPAQAELYDGPHTEWLRELLERLPNLQSLVVSGLPFFDHYSLLAIGAPEERGQGPTRVYQQPSFPLRLLIADHGRNATCQSLENALQTFRNLNYLDLSDTYAARGQSFLRSLGNLPSLQVLKLRNVHLKDEHLAVLANAIGSRVRSLDLSQNLLTDQSVQTLLKVCIGTSDPRGQSSSNTGRLTYDSEDWPAGIVRPDPATLDELRDEIYDHRFLRRLTSGAVSRLPFEDLPDSGVTHLRLSGNTITVNGVAALIRSEKLHLLEVASLRSWTRTIGSSPGRPTTQRSASNMGSLVTVLARYALSITYLRIDHTVVTELAPPKEEDMGLSIAELDVSDSRSPVQADSAEAVELGAKAPPYELDTRGPAPRYELVGDSLPVVVSPAIGEKPHLTREEKSAKAKRGSVFAPEPVEPPVEDSTALEATAASNHDTIAQNSLNEGRPMPMAPSGLSAHDHIFSNLYKIHQQREELRRTQRLRDHGLVPALVPNLRTLVLTDVPIYDSSPNTVKSIVQFIKYCAAEADLAAQEAVLRKELSSRSKHSQVPTSATLDTFHLRRLVLEMAPFNLYETRAGSSVTDMSGPLHRSTFPSRTKSSTGDADSEAFWSASENDFTFFDDDEECGLPAAETNVLTRVPLSAISEKMVTGDGDSSGQQKQSSPTYDYKGKRGKTRVVSPSNASEKQQQSGQSGSDKSLPLIDVIYKIAAFRQERRAAFEASADTQRGSAGSRHHYVEGHWPGEVKVVKRSPRDQNESGTVDFYGNLFDEGGVYR